MQKKNHKIISINEYNPKIYDLVYNKLNDYEKDKITRMPKDRVVHFIMGRYLMIKEGLDVIKVYYNKNGKPCLDNVFFSISHSDEYTILITSDKEIGIDIEHIKHINNSLKKTFLKREASDIEFLEYMTKMESYIKLNGYGLSHFDDDISDYNFESFKYIDYLITICERK